MCETCASSTSNQNAISAAAVRKSAAATAAAAVPPPRWLATTVAAVPSPRRVASAAAAPPPPRLSPRRVAATAAAPPPSRAGKGQTAADGIVLEVEGPDGIVQEAEGLKLHLNPRSASGYRGVTANPDRGSGSRSFRAMAGRVYLGYFATAVEAAVRIARHVQQQEPEAMEEEQEAEQEPEAMEGQEEEEEEDRQRELRVGDAIEGQYGTDKSELWWPGTVTRVWRGGKVDVRYDDGDTELKKAPSRVRRLQLHRSSSSSGYKGVYRTKHGRFEVRLMLGSVDKYLGVFGTALEAAEAYARALALEQEAEAMEEVQEEEEEAEEAPVQEAEGLQLHLSSRSKTGGQRTFIPPLQYSPRLRHSPAVASLRRLPGRLLSQQLYHCALSNGDQG